MLFLLLIVFILVPYTAQAAYQNPIVIANERQANGTTKLLFRFNGNAGEPAVTRDFTVLPSTTATLLRNWIDSTINELDLMHTAATLPSVQPGQTVTRLAPVPPALTAKAIWKRKVEIYKHFSDSGFLGAIATDLSTLKADIESTYQAGFMNPGE